MTRRSTKFTQADIARCIRAAQQCGAGRVAILPDGTIEIEPRPSPDTESDEAPSRRRRFGERLADPQERAASWDDVDDDQGMDPLTRAFQRWRRGEIRLDELPPGRYPNGMRVYADGEWEAIVRSRPLGKREIAALEAYFKADGLPNFLNGGPDTNERLEVRGLIEKSDEPRQGRMPHYRTTSAGKTEWLRRT